MGTGAKIALVALLVVAVVVVAKVVQRSGDDENPENKVARVAGSTNPKSGASPSTGSAATSKSGPTAADKRRIDIGNKKPSAEPGSSTAGDAGSASRSSPASPGILRSANPPAASGGAASPPTSGSSTATPAPAPGATTASPADTVRRLPAAPEAASALAAGATSGTGGAAGPSPTPSGSTPAATAASGGVALSESTLKVRSSPDATAGADSTAPTTGVVRVKPGAAAPPPASTGGAAAPGSVNPVRPAATLTTLNPGVAGAAPGKTFPVEHTVVSGDTYWGLSRKYYGSSSHTELIKTANKGVTPQPGKKLVIPTPPAAAETTPQPSGRTVSPDPARAVASGTPPAEPKSGEVAGFSIAALPADADYYYYTVQKGDTLSGLAKRFYADSTSFHRIQGANKHLHYEMLRAGMKIRIPKAAK